MIRRMTRASLPLLAASMLLLGACSSGNELEGGAQPGTGQQDEEFKKTDTGESALPATDQPADARTDQQATGKPDAPMPADEESLAPATAKPEPAAKPETTAPGAQADAPASSAAPAPAASTAPRAGAAMWSVQLGAFKQEAGAAQLVTELKQKFNQPVYRNFDAASGFYKVTLGSFPNRDQAAAYKMEVQARGYPDAFVVEVTR